MVAGGEAYAALETRFVTQTAKFKLHAPSRRKRAELLTFMRRYQECKRQLL